MGEVYNRTHDFRALASAVGALCTWAETIEVSEERDIAELRDVLALAHVCVLRLAEDYRELSASGAVLQARPLKVVRGAR